LHSESTFTDLGGDSISATLLLSQIKAQWRISLPIDILFENMTLPKLAALLEQRLAGQENPRTLPPITRQPRDGALPLSQSQRRMWLVQSFAPDTTAYNVTYALRLKGKLDRAALMKAVEQVWSRPRHLPHTRGPVGHRGSGSSTGEPRSRTDRDSLYRPAC
jgi:hypothetical protein